MTIYHVREMDRETGGARWFSFEHPTTSDRTSDGVGFCRSATAINAFFFSTKRRNLTDKRLFTMRRPDEFGRADEEEIRNGTVIALASVREFFTTIGYDYKKTSYSTGETIEKR